MYSAFYDKRASRMIRIIGATRTRSPERVWCRFWYDDAATANDNATALPERRRYALMYTDKKIVEMLRK